MRGVALFALGVAFGLVITLPGRAQVEPGPGLNHVGFRVKDLDATLAFYTKTMGFREVGPVRDDKGTTLFTYVQIDRNTFIELFPPAAGEAPGFTHVALKVDDVDETVRKLREAKIEVEAPRMGRTRAYLTNASGPDGVRIELLELRPESIQRQAVESWPGPRRP
jgi:catechol 2,3-dioxygenase-like lactoylglutathione lyase family enzyme